MAGSGVLASRDQSVRWARALSPRPLAHRSISGAPICPCPADADLSGIGRDALEVQQRHEGFEPWIGRSVLSVPVLIGVLQGESRQACGCASSGCWRGGSAIGAAPWPSPAGTKLDAMNWPSRAAPAAGELPLAALLRSPAPGCRTLLPGPPSRTSCPPPPIRMSSPAPPVQRVVAGAADQDVVAVAAIGGELHAGREPGRR